MNKGNHDIDRLARDAFEEWEDTPSPKVLGSIQRKMFLYNLSRNRQLFLLLALLLLIGGSSYFVFSGSKAPAPETALQTLYHPAGHAPAVTSPAEPLASADVPSVPTHGAIAPAQKPANDIRKSEPPVTAQTRQIPGNVPVNTNKAENPNTTTYTFNTNNTATALNTSPKNTTNPDKANPGNFNRNTSSLSGMNVKQNGMEGITYNYLTSLTAKHIQYDFSRSLLSNGQPEKKSPFRQSFLMIAAYTDAGTTRLHREYLVSEPQGQNAVSIDPHLCLGAGVLAEMQKGRFVMSAGMQYTSLTFQGHAPELLTNPENFTDYNFTGNQLQFDTVGGYWHYTYISDSIIHVSDSIWEWLLQENYVPQYDTIHYTLYDTLKNARWKERYSLVEIPVTAGYAFRVGRLDCNVQGGLIFGVLTSYRVRTDGFTDNTSLILNETYKKNQLLISATASVNANWWLNEKMAIFVQPYFRKSITNFYSELRTSRSEFLQGGLRAGLRIKL